VLVYSSRDDLYSRAGPIPLFEAFPYKSRGKIITVHHTSAYPLIIDRIDSPDRPDWRRPSLTGPRGLVAL
jgi:hypothetical protein